MKTVRVLDIHSSAFKAASWFPAKQLLLVTFNNGQIWEYQDVTEEDVTALEKAESQGQYFRQNIRTKQGRRM